MVGPLSFSLSPVSRVPMVPNLVTLLVEKIMHLALLFCSEVCEQDICKSIPWEWKDAQDDKLSNLRSLSHWTNLMVRSNCVDT
jgi:hypothetical protein